MNLIYSIARTIGFSNVLSNHGTGRSSTSRLAATAVSHRGSPRHTGMRPLHLSKSGWDGWIIARVLPTSVDDGYEERKPQVCRIDPSQLTVTKERGTDNAPEQPDMPCYQNMGGLVNESPAEIPPESLHFPREAKSLVTDKSISTVTTTLDIYLNNSTSPSSEHNPLVDPLHIHMKRSSDEDIDRTLQRLNISIDKKMKPHGSRRHSKDQQIPSFKESQNSTTSPSFWTVPLNQLDRLDEENQNFSRSQVPLVESKEWMGIRSSKDLWQSIATKDDFHPTTRGHTVLRMNHPESSMLNDQAVMENNYIWLQIEACPPTLLSISTFEAFEGYVFVGVPLVVETELLFATHAVIDWYVDGHLRSHDTMSFTPVSTDIGKNIAVDITPIRPGHDGYGFEETYQYQKKVEPLPFMPILSPLRSEWVTPSDINTDSLRVVTYNLLSDSNAGQEGSAAYLYPQCDSEHLLRKRRMPMIIYELLAYQADLICLQEVDMLVYDTLLRPVLSEKGYQGFYSNKIGNTREGCAMFWSLDRFEALIEDEPQTFPIRDLFPLGKNEDISGFLEDWKSVVDVKKMLEAHDDLREMIEDKLGHVLQTVTLTLKSGELVGSMAIPSKILVANTHLYYHGRAGHIRLMQLLMACYCIEKERCKDGERYPFVFAGDFNSAVHSGAIQLMLRRTVGPTGSTWKHLHTFSWRADGSHNGLETQSGSEDECNDRVCAPTTSLPDSFPVLCSGYGELPLFSHYITKFQETLDYIFASQPSERDYYGFATKTWAPMPSRSDVAQYGGMPNEFMPSDHVSLVCDLAFQNHSSPSKNDEAT